MNYVAALKKDDPFFSAPRQNKLRLSALEADDLNNSRQTNIFHFSCNGHNRYFLSLDLRYLCTTVRRMFGSTGLEMNSEAPDIRDRTLSIKPSLPESITMGTCLA